MTRGDETPLYKLSEAKSILGVSEGILRRWADTGKIKSIRTPGGMRLFDVSSINPKLKTIHKNTVILYSRVSSTKQTNDLLRQKEYIKQNIPDQYSKLEVDEVTDVGSGLNFKRPGLLRILGLVKQGKVSAIVVASRDRMARFGFELIEWMCTEFGTKIVVLDNEDTTPESELSKDLMAIVQVYCCRWNGKRRYKNKGEDKESKTEAKADNSTERDS